MLNASVRLYVSNIPDYFKTQQLQKRALSVFMFPHNGFSRALNKMYDEAINQRILFCPNSKQTHFLHEMFLVTLQYLIICISFVFCI